MIKNGNKKVSQIKVKNDNFKEGSANKSFAGKFAKD